MNKLKVAVLMGGLGCEREISLVSGRHVFDNLDRRKYDPILIDVPTDLEMVKGCELAFIAMHGEGGEDGRIQGYLDTLGIKYTGCGVLASAMGMNKKVFKFLMESNGVVVPKNTKKIPCVVKPVCGGSSKGVSVVDSEKDINDAVAYALEFDDEVVFEEYIKGVEVTCGVWGNDKVTAMPVVEINPKGKFFDYDSKYSDDGAQEICPARLSKNLTTKVQNIAIKVFKIIGGKGFARVDMIIAGEEVYVLDINTLPGLTPNSLLPKEAKAMGMSFSELLDKLIDLARL